MSQNLEPILPLWYWMYMCILTPTIEMLIPILTHCWLCVYTYIWKKKFGWIEKDLSFSMDRVNFVSWTFKMHLIFYAVFLGYLQ